MSTVCALVYAHLCNIDQSFHRDSQQKEVKKKKTNFGILCLQLDEMIYNGIEKSTWWDVVCCERNNNSGINEYKICSTEFDRIWKKKREEFWISCSNENLIIFEWRRMEEVWMCDQYKFSHELWTQNETKRKSLPPNGNNAKYRPNISKSYVRYTCESIRNATSIDSLPSYNIHIGR